MAAASSPSWEGRARAGRDLAAFAEVPEVAGALVRLLLDAEDTAVTRRTAEALARVGSVAAVRVLARAVAGADEGQADWLETGVLDAEAPDVAAACAALAWDREEAVRRGAAEVAVWVGANGGSGDRS
ncbi:HEAT repeat domain-containing protein [Streptomyces sp. NPDC091040]|uniref:HEAT repeat domain-containing protein n=1 Tax=Streptomyces sp. NPDC091040 TaxID=3365972 RepID=UPI00382FACE0